MAVHLHRMYSKTGDAGMTALGDGSRVAKTDPRIQAYANIDETNAAIGVALALGDLPDEIHAVFEDHTRDGSVRRGGRSLYGEHRRCRDRQRYA